VIWGRDQGKYFFSEDWTTQIRLKRLGKMDFWRRPPNSESWYRRRRSSFCLLGPIEFVIARKGPILRKTCAQAQADVLALPSGRAARFSKTLQNKHKSASLLYDYYHAVPSIIFKTLIAPVATKEPAAPLRQLRRSVSTPLRKL
jgi:hypothetical protein